MGLALTDQALEFGFQLLARVVVLKEVDDADVVYELAAR